MSETNRNIEIKAASRDFPKQREIAESLIGSSAEILMQEDYYFYVPNGRLKLRLTQANKGQLIYYDRPDEHGPKVSNYKIYETDVPDRLLELLGSSYGIRSTVRKKRYLYIFNRTRIHLDKVKDLGNFIELEVVLGAGDSYEEGKTEAQYLIERLGIEKQDLVSCSYIDLLGRE